MLSLAPATRTSTLSLHDALPICNREDGDERWSIVRSNPVPDPEGGVALAISVFHDITAARLADDADRQRDTDRKSTRLNSSHVEKSYAVFCLKKKTAKHKA